MSADASTCTPLGMTTVRRKSRTVLFVEFGTTSSTRMLRGRQITLKFVYAPAPSSVRLMKFGSYPSRSIAPAICCISHS
ncbi:MAG: hypothetical protein BWY59_00521 [Verrucomicrobia bacterium ADurb.Bin345]|nr:MAG: hypothetical protein BWY59_00521 [Verrucomicrobia bacterium ADurb.Bin345]